MAAAGKPWASKKVRISATLRIGASEFTTEQGGSNIRVALSRAGDALGGKLQSANIGLAKGYIAFEVLG
jgi:hypothetical protein